MTVEDAAALANAIEAALDDVPRHDAMPGKSAGPSSPFEFFSGDQGRKDLVEFVAFCREGAFSIG